MATEKKPHSSSSRKKTPKKSLSTVGLPTTLSNQLKETPQFEAALAQAEQQWEKHLQSLTQTTKKQIATAKTKLKAALAKEKAAEKKLSLAKKKAVSNSSKAAKNNVTRNQKQLKITKQNSQKAQKQVTLLEKILLQGQEKIAHSKARKKALVSFAGQWRKTLQNLRKKPEKSKKGALKKPTAPSLSHSTTAPTTSKVETNTARPSSSSQQPRHGQSQWSDETSPPIPKPTQIKRPSNSGTSPTQTKESKFTLDSEHYDHSFEKDS